MRNISTRISTETETRSSDPVSAIELVDSLLSETSKRGASDIHLIPEKGRIRVRVRIDGLLEDIRILPVHMHPPILARIKVLSGLRTDEHFAGQDGRFRFKAAGGHESDVRVSIAPTYYGESAVLRLLSNQKEAPTLRALGCRNSHQLMLTRALERPHGMILATGPTGSGKTTLLYSLLQMLDSETRSIVTLEDPIEYSLPGINQMPVNTERGLGFANGLRSVLRQDPDVIMVGEIRDTETARLAINASLTGHLVLSSLHTNEAASTVPRLIDIGIEPYLIASTLQIIVAQRLVRKICDACRIESVPRESGLERIRSLIPNKISGSETFFEGIGCEECRFLGYKGRVGIFEILLIDDVIREAILDRTSTEQLRVLAHTRGMLTLLGDGLEKARKGLTSIEEVARISYA